MPGSSTRKATWTPSYHEAFVDLCLEETLKGNKPGTHFTREGWSNIIASFREKFGVNYDKVQIKNHWDITKRQWRAWVKLTREPSLKWDPVAKKFCATVEEWSNYIRGNPGAAQFQFKELQSTDKLEIIYGGNVNSEETEHDTRRKRRDCSSGTSVNDEEDEYLCDTTAVSRADKIRRREDFASGRTTPISAPHKFKATWAPPIHKAFIDLCLEETLKGNKPGTHFNRDGWKNILESFHNRTGLKYTRMQLKNHWDSTKEQWKIWCKLVEANILRASDEVWTSYLQENPEAAQFHNRELQFADKLDTIFDYTPDAGEKIYYSASPLQTVKPEIMQPEDETPERPCDPFESDSDTIIQKNVVRAPAPLTHNKLTYSIGECIDCLDSLQELEQGSELYLFALDVFLKKEYREIFLQLKNPGLRISWLQRLQANGQPLQL